MRRFCTENIIMNSKGSQADEQVFGVLLSKMDEVGPSRRTLLETEGKNLIDIAKLLSH